MRVAILTEELSQVVTNICVELVFSPKIDEIALVVAQSKLQEKKLFFQKALFIRKKLKVRGWIYYMRKFFDSFIEKRNIKRDLLMISSTTCLSDKMQIHYVDTHNSNNSLELIDQSDICFVVGCRHLNREICKQAVGKSFVLHSSDPRKHIGVTLPAFWETIEGDDKFRLSIIELHEQLDSGKIAYQEEFSISGIKPEYLFKILAPKMILAVIGGHRKILPSEEKIPKFHPNIKKSDLKKYKRNRKYAS